MSSGESSITVIISIFAGIILMTLIPIMSIAEQNDHISQSVVQAEASEFATKEATIGAIMPDDLEMFKQSIAEKTNNLYDIQIEIQHLDENPIKKPASTSGNLAGENLRISTYLTDIEKYMYDTNPPKPYPLNKGDIIIITVQNTNRTTAQQLSSFVLNLLGKDTSKILVNDSVMVINNHNGR